MRFSHANFHKYDKVCRDLCSVSHAKTYYCFSKICKPKIEFSTNIRMTILRRKTNKSYDTTAVRNDPGYKTKKIVNLILKNVMLKAIVEVYIELLVTNFYAQIFCNRHSKFVKIIPILMLRTFSAVFVYISFPPLIKLFWLVTCPTNSGQK